MNNRKSQQSDKIEQRNSKRYSLLQKGSSLVISVNQVVLFLQVLHMLAFGYNYPIVRKYKNLIESLLLYCYKQKFPVIKNYDFIKWVLKCAFTFYQPELNELRIYPKFKLGIVDSPSDESKFKEKKFKNSMFPIINVGISQSNSFNHTPQIP